VTVTVSSNSIPTTFTGFILDFQHATCTAAGLAWGTRANSSKSVADLFRFLGRLVPRRRVASNLLNFAVHQRNII
jgi:hypothetical protein